MFFMVACTCVYDIKSFSVFYIICIYIEYLLQNHFFITSFVIKRNGNLRNLFFIERYVINVAKKLLSEYIFDQYYKYITYLKKFLCVTIKRRKYYELTLHWYRLNLEKVTKS